MLGLEVCGGGIASLTHDGWEDKLNFVCGFVGKLWSMQLKM